MERRVYGPCRRFLPLQPPCGSPIWPKPLEVWPLMRSVISSSPSAGRCLICKPRLAIPRTIFTADFGHGSSPTAQLAGDRPHPTNAFFISLLGKPVTNRSARVCIRQRVFAYEEATFHQASRQRFIGTRVVPPPAVAPADRAAQRSAIYTGYRFCRGNGPKQRR